MKRLPDRLLTEIDSSSRVIWWGRRAFFEVIEELAEASYKSVVVSLVFRLIYYVFEDAIDLQVFLGFYVVAILWALWTAIKEYNMWTNEVYIVVLDNSGGGRIHKFWGWLSKNAISEKITDTSPAIRHERPWYWRLWGMITGEQMCIIHLYSQNHGAFIQGRKVSPAMVSAINAAKNAPPESQDRITGNHEMSDILRLRDLVTYGLIDKKMAREAAEMAISRSMFGDRQ